MDWGGIAPLPTWWRLLQLHMLTTDAQNSASVLETLWAGGTSYEGVDANAALVVAKIL